MASRSCAAADASDEEADDSSEATESSESELSAANLVGKRYAVTGTFVIREFPTMANRNPKETVLGDGGAEINVPAPNGREILVRPKTMVGPF